MKRSHRKAHRVVWLVLTLLVAIGFTMALVNRKPQKKKKAQTPAIEQVSPVKTSAIATDVAGRVSL